MSPSNETTTKAPEPIPWRTLAVWFCIGAAAGATVGLLYAPCPGEETREALKTRLSYAADSSRVYIESAKGYVERFVDTARVQAGRLSVSMAAGVEEARRVKQELVDLQEQDF